MEPANPTPDSEAVPDGEAAPPAARRTVVVQNADGLHLRPARRASEIAGGFASETIVRHGERTANGRSMMSLMLLVVEPGSELSVEAVGPDAEAAAEALAEFLGAAHWDLEA